MRTHMNKKENEKTNQSLNKQVTPVKTKYLVYTFLKLNCIKSFYHLLIVFIIMINLLFICNKFYLF